MAITALAFGLTKSLAGGLMGGSKDKAKKDPSQASTPKVAKVDGLKSNQTPDAEKLKEDKATKAKPTTPTRVTRQSISSPMLKKTGIVSVDSALQNVSKSLGSIKGTMAAQAQFNKAEDKRRADAARKRKRDKKEKGSEKGPIGAVLGAIGKAVPFKSIFGSIFKYFLNIILGSLVIYVLRNAEKIVKKIGEVIDVVKDFFGTLNKYVITPVFNMVKAIAGPVNTAIKAMLPEELPDFDQEKKDAQAELDKFEIQIPIIEDLIKGFDNFLSTGDPRITKEEFKEQVESREDSSGAPQATPPTARGGSSSTSASGDASTAALLDTISFAEGTPSYGTIYGGAVVPELERGELTIAQVLEMQRTGKLNGRDVGYARDSRDSDATGRYQFMSYVLKEEIQIQKISPSEKFTPEMQDRIILHRLKRMRGVTPELVAKEGMSANVIDRLAPEFASFPNLMGDVRYGYGTSYYGQGGKSEQSIRDKYNQRLQSQRQNQTQTTPPTSRGVRPQTPLMGTAGAYNTGLVTGPARFIGGSSEYHIDTKIKADIPMQQAVAMVDSMAIAYAKVGREIEFSNSAVSGLVYDPNASYNEKASLLKRVFGAHAPRGGWRSMDYYIPLKTDAKGRFGKSSEGAEIIAPVVPGGTVEFHQGGRYGAFVVVTDANGRVISKTGHGDIRGVRSGTVQIPRGQNNQSNGVGRQASYDGLIQQTVIVPTPTPTPAARSHGGGASGMMSGPGRGQRSNTYNRDNAHNKLYKQ